MVVPATSVLLRSAAMDDILSHGGDREPSRWPRRLAVIAALIAVVVGGAIYLGRPGHQHAAVASHPSSVAASQAPAQAGPDVLSLPPEPNGIPGRTLAWDSALRLLAGGARPAWFSPASGRSEQIGGLPADQSGYQFVRVVGGWAVQASAALPAGCGSCAPSPAPVWFLADGAHSARRVGTASLVAPAATAGAVWLTSYAPGVNMTSAAGMAWEAGSAGALTRPVRLPGGYVIDQGTDRGLLLAPLGLPPRAAADKLWDPSAPEAGQAFAAVLAASPREIAWTSQCALTCSVQTLDLATGRRTTIALPAGSAAASGTFSPDGRFLALQVSFGNSGDGGELATQLEVAPAGGSRLTIVPGTGTSSDALVGFGWPASGDSLVVEFSFTTKTQLASWDPGALRPAVAVVRPGASQASLILG
jgi:hypothetical protein